jgi:hypothetical protein
MSVILRTLGVATEAPSGEPADRVSVLGTRVPGTAVPYSTVYPSSEISSLISSSEIFDRS